MTIIDQGTTLAILLQVQGTYPRSEQPCRYGKCLAEQHVTADALTASTFAGMTELRVGGHRVPKLW